MRSESWLGVRGCALAFLAVLPTAMLGCGDGGGDSIPDPPEPVERMLPTSGNIEEVERKELTEPKYEIGEVTTDASFQCCEITFALASAGDEERVTLRGSDAPLNVEAGIPLTRKNGVWSTTVCVPPDYSGFYYYVAAIPADDPDAGGALELVRHNDHVPVLEDPILGTVNRFESADTCAELNVAVHATTTP